jgi:hypothetical protein
MDLGKRIALIIETSAGGFLGNAGFMGKWVVGVILGKS